MKTREKICLYLIHFLLLTTVVPSSSLSSSSGAERKNKKLKILGVFSHPGKSHFDVFKPLLEELANRGHDLTVVSYFPRTNSSSALPNYKDIDLTGPEGVFLEIVDLKKIKHSILTVYREFMLLRHWGLEHCQKNLANRDVQKLIKSNAKFDLIITEVFNSDCFLGFVHRFKAPFIGLSSHVLFPWANARLSNEHNPSYVPTVLLGFGPKMNFMERVGNYVIRKIFNLGYEVFYNRPMQKIVEKSFGPNVPPLGDLAKNMSVILVNMHYSLQGSKPNLPSVVEVGGLHISEKQQSLPGDIQRFLDDAKEGVVFFSWGSMIKASSMGEETLREIVKALRSIPWKVIWKWEDEDLPGKPENVMIKKWVPQAAILGHPNVKCYLAHGGLLGVSESVSAGVPMVIVPMYGDQFNNAAAARSRGVALVLEWNNLDAESLKAAIDKIFNDQRYKKNAKALQKAWHERPMSALETSIWWSEYVARGHGNYYLKTAAADLTWYQLELLDVIVFLLLIILIVILVFYKIVNVIIRKIFTSLQNFQSDFSKKHN
ncbi:UDP-glucuronosyltransferase 2B30 [Diachasma alloeum]|uniref:UDP-glucuronosyltransferase 2B30 n=1 Tax=Diachasma alloeum TaxID=454923 RepID=UPI00073818DF|nr:UDP-glucuronosyltransferase 2B30 [Diachasma alloeum]